MKDTVLVSLGVPGRSGHVEQHQPGLVGLVDDDLVEFDGRVHPPDVGVVAGGEREGVEQLLDEQQRRAAAAPRNSRSHAEHVSEALGGGAARVRGPVLGRPLFGPGHLDPSMVLGAAAAAATSAASAAAAHRPLSLSSVCVVVVVRSDAGEPQHRVAVFDQLSLVRNTQKRQESLLV